VKHASAIPVLSRDLGFADCVCKTRPSESAYVCLSYRILNSGMLNIALADYNSAFPAGGTVAASWDRQVWYDRGYAMGSEHNGKGVDVQLGPVVGPLGRVSEGGRNWEGFSPDPVLSGIAVAQTVQGIQAAGVVACMTQSIIQAYLLHTDSIRHETLYRE
jgi:Glycosyl hydrolase family 3 N terminal domain